MARPLRPVVAVLAAMLALTGCGSSSPADRLAAYISQVNRVERALSVPLSAITAAGSNFITDQRLIVRGDPAGRAAQRRIELSLVRASAQVRGLDARLAALRPPGRATRLRSLLIRYTAGELEMTSELRGMIAFVPAFAQALGPVPAATRTLQRTLARAVTPGASAAQVTTALRGKARALLVYRATLGSVLAGVRRLAPPPVSRAQARAEISALLALRASAAGLARALTTDQAAIPAALTRFDRASIQTSSLATQRAEIAAIRAYDARNRTLAVLQGQIQSERLRLIYGPGRQTSTRS